MTFMERINKNIEEYLAERDSEKYLSSMEKMAEDYRAGRSSVKYPENIMDDGDAKSFYGAVCSGIKKSLGDKEIEVTDSMGMLALNVKEIIVSHTKRDWRDNVIVHRNIKKHWMICFLTTWKLITWIGLWIRLISSLMKL